MDAEDTIAQLGSTLAAEQGETSEQEYEDKIREAFRQLGIELRESVVQDTLDACNAQNVAQMEEAVALIYCKHSRDTVIPTTWNSNCWT